MTDLFRIVAVLLLVLGNAFFVAAEYALVTARRSHLNELAARGSLRARFALRIMDSPTRFIGTVQLGITAFSIALGAIGEPLVEHFLDPVLATGVAFLLAFAIVTYLHVTIGELVPKAIALTKNESTALWVAVPVEIFYVATYPLVWVLQASANAVTRLFGIEPAPAGVVAHTEADIRMIVAQAEDTGVIETTEEEMLYKVFDFADKEVHEVMVPRPQVVALSIDLPPEECLAAVIDSPYTRYPVYRENLDDIAGVLHVRDLFSAMHDEGIADVEVGSILRAPYIVPETKDLAALLAEFRNTKQHMAVVVDEYGAFRGIVTLEDLLEELVGEIRDEYDEDERLIQRVGPRTFRVSGRLPIHELNDVTGLVIPDDSFDTVGGWALDLFGRVPHRGEKKETEDGVRVSVEKVERTRVLEVMVALPEVAEPREAR